MKIGSIDLEQDILIVAEIGNNHEGSYTLAEEMIGLAAHAGANAVKFQTFRTEHYVSKTDEARFSRLKRFELSFDEFERLAGVARREGVLFLSTPFDLESAEFLRRIVPAYKIASGDNDFYPLLESVAGYGKPIILSTGLAEIDQIRRSVAVIRRVWSERKINESIATLHCVTSYPVPPEEANLAAIQTLKERFGGVVGYSDHTIGIEAAVIAAILGARIIEKHFTFNNTYSDFRDHQLSADPRDFSEMVRRIRQAQVLLGQGGKVIQPCEQANQPAVRRSIVARRDLPRGSLITQADLDWIRPGGGLSPGNEYLLIGRRLARAVSAGEALTPETVGK